RKCSFKITKVRRVGMVVDMVRKFRFQSPQLMRCRQRHVKLSDNILFQSRAVATRIGRLRDIVHRLIYGFQGLNVVRKRTTEEWVIGIEKDKLPDIKIPNDTPDSIENNVVVPVRNPLI